MDRKFAITVVAAGVVAIPAIAHAEVIIKDSLQKDQGWAAWDSKFAFSDMGMTAYGVVTRDFKEFPTQFDAAVTIDASKSIIWGFGVAGDYSPKTGYSGIGITANSNKQVGVMFARWENDSIVDMVQIDADATQWIDGIHTIVVSVRDDVAFATIDEQTVAKIGYNAKHAGSQIVIASFAEGDTYFRDLTVTSRIPSPGAGIVGAWAAAIGARRRRNTVP